MVVKKAGMAIDIRENMRGGAGKVELTALSPELPGNMRLFSRIRLAPGCSIGYHVHENETELFAFISGCGRVKDNEVEYDVCAGDSMLTFPGSGHSVENTGECDLVLIAAIVKQ